MIRELFRIGPVSISPFGVTLVAAFLLAFVQLRWGLRRQGIGDEEDASAILFWAGVGAIVGGKVYYAILYRDWHLLYSRSGLVFYGGFLLAVVLVVWAVWRRRLPFWPTLDAAALSIPPGYAMGRIGCFLVGDDYGVPTDLPWGVVFRHGLPETTAFNLREQFGLDLPASIPDDAWVPVHPTQLYETTLALAIWAVGLAVFRRRPRPGATMCLVLALSALERFGIEFLRAKDDRILGPFTVAQAIAVAVLLAAVGLWVARFRRPAAA
jgi:phosphatidylglycerol:prolipoprotein diacylglycerol transferase